MDNGDEKEQNQATIDKVHPNIQDEKILRLDRRHTYPVRYEPAGSVCNNSLQYGALHREILH